MMVPSIVSCMVGVGMNGSEDANDVVCAIEKLHKSAMIAEYKLTRFI
jgi:hypothetical protein